MAVAGVASADRPTAAEAKKTAEDWLDGLHIGEDAARPDEAVSLTAASLFAVGFNDGPDQCDATTARTPAAIVKALTCLRKVITRSALEPWTKKAAKELPAPLRRYKSKLTALEKTATLVHHHTPCVGEGGDLIVAVAQGKGAAGAMKVVAVFSQNLFCGE